MRSLVEFSQLSYHDLLRYLEVAQSLLRTIQHEEATPHIVERRHRVHRLDSQESLTDLSRLQEASSCQFVLLCIVESLSKSTVGQGSVWVEVINLFSIVPTLVETLESVVILTS